MGREKIMPFVEARAKLSQILDRVAEQGDIYVLAKRQKPVAVIMALIDTVNCRARPNI